VRGDVAVVYDTPTYASSVNARCTLSESMLHSLQTPKLEIS